MVKVDVDMIRMVALHNFEVVLDVIKCQFKQHYQSIYLLFFSEIILCCCSLYPDWLPVSY